MVSASKNFLTAALLCGTFIFAIAVNVALANASPLDETLAKLDAAAKKFTAAQADFEWDTYQKIVNDTDKQYGTIWFKRTGDATEMRSDVSDTPHGRVNQIVIYKDGELQYFQPTSGDLKTFAAGKNQSQYESFLTLGFGGSGTDLKKNWDITYQGTEQMQGVTVTKLDLKPIQPSVAKQFTHVTIWIDAPRAVSLQQKFFYPSGDARTAIYSNISEKNLPASQFVMPNKKSARK